jgi:hypothetical protein
MQAGQEYARQEANREGRDCLLCEVSRKAAASLCVGTRLHGHYGSRGFHMCVSLAWHGIYSTQQYIYSIYRTRINVSQFNY